MSNKKDTAWWRFLKVVYIMVYIPFILLTVLGVRMAISDYESATKQNADLQFAQSHFQVDAARKAGYSDTEISNQITKKYPNLNLPYFLDYQDPYSVAKTFFYILAGYFIVVELVRKAIVYIIGVPSQGVLGFIISANQRNETENSKSNKLEGEQIAKSKLRKQ